jgi:release factor glutamine methyltransferase
MNQHHAQWTILDILQWTTAYFQEKDIQNPRLTAEVLLAHTLQQDRMYLYVHYDQPLEPAERSQFKTLIKQRANGTPTQYLTGKQEFWSLEFQVAPGVLIPRPETEHLVEAALNLSVQFPQPTIVDIGTGSGIIAISLKKELPHADVYAGDISETALAIARQNADRLLNGEQSIMFRQGDLFQPFSGIAFDLIVSNPPYIRAAEYAVLAREIREHEPKEALYADAEGLDVYARLIAGAAAYLNPEGYVLVEIGYGQKDAVVGIFEQHGFAIKTVIPDYAKIDRVIVAQPFRP